MNRDRLEPRIAEDHLVECAHGRIAVVGGLHIGGQHPPHVGNAFQEFDRLGLAERLEIGLVNAMLCRRGHLSRLSSLGGGSLPGGHTVAQSAADLLGELVVQPIDQIAHVVGDIPQMEILAASVAGVENLLEVLARGDDRVVVGERAVAEIVDCGNVLIRLHNPARELGQLFL